MVDISTPAVWFPGQSEEELQEEINLMLLRSKATKAFIDGEISPDFFLDFLAQMGFDPLEISNDWTLNVAAQPS